ncbi:EAL domain-containing protein [Bradyrhizobium sp.]|uniref:bifunctional diguanylate cyclase/phosphodiesterase n=1 Tax=Bradyrhizobium sp. TaxID=376 RepID=UPI0027363F31|nr:EAL domain-containing protein [Bradyrhizobium sp.]MDP3693330.1 EAL domain-containing protein [Bradyrhizobium sp.]
MTEQPPASLNFPRTASGNPIRWLVVGGGFLIAAIAIGATVMAGSFRERALNSSARELENTVLLLARHFDQQLQDFGAIQQDVATYVQLAGIETGEDYRRRMSSADIHQMLKAKIDAFSYVGSINLFDVDGVMINSSTAWPPRSVNISDRAYFKTFKSDPKSPPLLVEPLKSRVTGVWTTVLARKLTGPNGEFLGVIGRGIEHAGFTKFFQSVALGRDSTIAMHHRDGTLLARHPHVEEMVGRNFKTGPAHQRELFDKERASTRLGSPMDGRDRLVSARALPNFPIVIIASTTVASALAGWQEQIGFLATVAGLFVLVIAALLFMVVRKLSKQHLASQQRLRLEKQRLDTAVNNMTQGLLLFDSSQRLVICNQRYIDMYGLSPDVVKPGCSFREVIAHRKATGSFVGDDDKYYADTMRGIAHGNINVIEVPDGRSIQIVNEPLADGGWVATHEDITARRQTEARITHLAHYDALTDLPNRALFHDRLKNEFATLAAGGQFAVLYLDIDEFKSVNDSLGHLIGDELLKSVSITLSQCAGSGNFVARLGGDEFAIIQTAVKSDADVTDLVARVFEAIRQPFDCHGHQVTTDASIGIALAPQHGADFEQILKNADLAMYAAKTAGRRTHRFFELDMDARVKARRSLELDLRRAIADGAFEVQYQPCVSLRDNRISGCEALLRWRHPERGVISPAEFIPIAEDTGLINQLGEWVLTTACVEAATWPDEISIAVNVSPVQFRSGSFALRVLAALASSGLPARRLELEITEAVLIRDDEAALAILHQLRAIGVRIALDDFGTGYSSLSYLHKFPFDKIKIDRCFINDIAETGGTSSIVKAVVDIAAARSMITTAEGVETEQQRDMLRALGCSEMQGWLFSPARTAADIRQLFFAHRKKSTAVA